MTSFLETGRFGASLETPIDLGKAVWSFTARDRMRYERGDNVDGLRYTCDRNDFDFEKLSVSVSLVRHVGGDGAAIFSLYDSNLLQAILHASGSAHPVVANDGSTIDQTSHFDLSKKRTEGKFMVRESRDGIKTWPLKPSQQVDAIMRRLSFAVRVAPLLVFDVVEGDRFVLEACYITAMKYEHTGEYGVFDSRKEVKDHGISLLHILSELHEA